MGKGWQIIARIILRHRIPILIIVGMVTVFMWMNRGLERVHDFAKIIPKDDPEYIDYQNFKKEFGEDGNVLIVGVKGDMFKLETFNQFYDFIDSLRAIKGVTNVLSLVSLYEIEQDKENRKFKVRSIIQEKPTTQAEVDSLKLRIFSLPFYRGLIFNETGDVTAVAVSLDKDRLNSIKKIEMSDNIVAVSEAFSKKSGAEVHYGGLPFIRVYMMKNVPKEMTLFLLLAILITGVALFFFFRSFYAVIFPLLVIGIIVVWSLGLLGLLNYKITILTAVVPALVTVIGIPNSIYLLTKYHFEFKRTNNKMKSLILVIEKIGIVTVMTNATTAVGFLVLMFTKIQILREFGIISGLSVIVTFFVSLLLIPIIFSFLPPPPKKHIKHTDNKFLKKVIRFLDVAVLKYRKVIYAGTLGLVILGFWGASLVKPVSYMVDDIPRDDQIYGDLKFLEDNFKGVMPFEIVINTRRKAGLRKMSSLKKIEELQNKINEIPEISRTTSVVDFIKFARQSLFGGAEKEYILPEKEEFNALILPYLKNTASQLEDGTSLVSAIVDSSFSKTRIRGNIKDVGSIRMAEIIDEIQVEIDRLFLSNTKSGRLEEGEIYKVFGDENFEIKYKNKVYTTGDVFTVKNDSTYIVDAGEGKVDLADKTMITGTTKIFIKGNQYLIKNLIQTFMIAFCVIALLMAVLFGSFKMVVISLFPNFLPLLLVAGIMGFMDIHLKPSTALIFSVAFGIAVDDTIHYLARYRLARKSGDDVATAVSNSFKDTGVSMIYTTIILFFGFVIFACSSYGGTAALGQLTSITLAIALFSNLLLLPSLLITLIRDKTKLPDGFIDYETEKEDVEAIKEIFSNDDENGESVKKDSE